MKQTKVFASLVFAVPSACLPSTPSQFLDWKACRAAAA